MKLQFPKIIGNSVNSLTNQLNKMTIKLFLIFINNGGLKDYMFSIKAHSTSIGIIEVHSIKSTQLTFILQFIELYEQNFNIELKYNKYTDAESKLIS